MVGHDRNGRRYFYATMCMRRAAKNARSLSAMVSHLGGARAAMHAPRASAYRRNSGQAVTCATWTKRRPCLMSRSHRFNVDQRPYAVAPIRCQIATRWRTWQTLSLATPNNAMAQAMAVALYK